jgi:hypothetical protein
MCTRHVPFNNVASSKINYIDDEEEERLDAILEYLCGNLNEDMHEQDYDHILGDLTLVPRKKKSNSVTKEIWQTSQKNPKPHLNCVSDERSILE